MNKTTVFGQGQHRMPPDPPSAPAFRSAVERGKMVHSNETLWQLIKVNLDAIRLDQQMVPVLWELGHTGKKDVRKWRIIWQICLDRIKINKDYVRLLVWHLVKRGDPVILDWMEERNFADFRL